MNDKSSPRVPLPNEHILDSDPPRRRGFLRGFVASLMGLVLGAVPAAAGLIAIFDPLLKRKPATEDSEFDFLPVTSMEAVPDDGIPRLFPVIADRTDAWTFSPNEQVGAVYIKRTSDKDVTAFNAICPHAGCFVGYDKDDDTFKCPCHTSSFTCEGKIIKPSPSPRDMDSLTAKIDDGRVMVAFANFIAGREEKKAKQ